MWAFRLEPKAPWPELGETLAKTRHPSGDCGRAGAPRFAQRSPMTCERARVALGQR
jgi:hypothetical protein